MTTLCMPVTKPLCLPTPFVGYQSAARWVSLKFCQADYLMASLTSDLSQALQGMHRQDHFPLSAEQCLKLVERIQEQLPGTRPAVCCTELQFRLAETEIYQLNRWRSWTENLMADLASQAAGHPNNQIVMGRIQKNYESLGDLRQRLAPKLQTG